MAKFFELTDENMELVEECFQKTGLHNYIEMKAFGVSKSKKMIEVAKNGPVTEYLANVPGSISVKIYEAAFDRLDAQTKKMLLDDAFNAVAYDGEKDKIIIGTPQICVSVSGRRTFGETLINAAEAAVMAIEQIEEEKKAAKE